MKHATPFKNMPALAAISAIASFASIASFSARLISAAAVSSRVHPAASAAAGTA
jgi:hypothetical protein